MVGRRTLAEMAQNLEKVVAKLTKWPNNSELQSLSFLTLHRVTLA